MEHDIVQEQFGGSQSPCAAGSDWRLHAGISPDSDTAEQDRWENDIEKAALVLHNKSKLLLPKTC